MLGDRGNKFIFDYRYQVRYDNYEPTVKPSLYKTTEIILQENSI